MTFVLSRDLDLITVRGLRRLRSSSSPQPLPSPTPVAVVDSSTISKGSNTEKSAQGGEKIKEKIRKEIKVHLIFVSRFGKVQHPSEWQEAPAPTLMLLAAVTHEREQQSTGTF